VYKADEGQVRKIWVGSFVGVGDADLFTNAQSVAVQTGVNVQHAIETAAVGFGNLPACIAGLDVIVGGTLRAWLRGWLSVDGSDQSKNQQKGDSEEQDEWE
jgi:hypothetical protein